MRTRVGSPRAWKNAASTSCRSRTGFVAATGRLLVTPVSSSRGEGACSSLGYYRQKINTAIRIPADCRGRLAPPREVMAVENSYDLVIIGAGEAGQAAAHLARRKGARVAIIDRELFGGSCPFWACK